MGNKYDKILGKYREDDASIVSSSAVYLKLDQTTPQTTIGTFSFQKVGVGTTNPSYTLCVNLDNGSSTPILDIYNVNTGAPDVPIQFRSGYSGLSHTSDILGQLLFAPNNTGGRFVAKVTDDSGVLTEAFRSEIYMSGGFIVLPTSGPSGVGSSVGSPWLAYCKDGTNWFTDSSAGDIAYRNTGGKLLFGNTSGHSALAITGDKLGIGTTAPLRALDINSADGNCLRLIYNDADGSAANYVDFLVSSSGDLTITPSGSDILLASDSIKLNFGAGTDMSIDYDGTSGNIKTDLVAASDLHIDCGTDKTVVLDEPVYDDLRVASGNIDRPGDSDPAWVSVAPGGSGTTTYLLEFAKNNYGTFTVQIPHSYKVGEDIKVHIHWTPGNRGNEENGATVGWKIDYTWANINGTFGTMSTADLSDACDGTDWKHQMTPDVTIDGHTAAKGISSMLICNVKRTDTGDDDTWASTTTGQLPLLLEVDFHFPIDTQGSRDWGTK